MKININYSNVIVMSHINYEAMTSPFEVNNSCNCLNACYFILNK